jgi:hypothetical protein
MQSNNLVLVVGNTSILGRFSINIDYPISNPYFQNAYLKSQLVVSAGCLLALPLTVRGFAMVGLRSTNVQLITKVK